MALPTVVVIDDDELCAKLAKFILRQSGYHVATADNGIEGFAMVHMLRPDVVVLDTEIPWVRGLSVARAIRADPILATARIVGASAQDPDDGRGQARFNLFDTCVSKPYRYRDLQAAVRLCASRPSQPYQRYLNDNCTSRFSP